MYLFVFRSPILEAFFLTASVFRLSCFDILAVGLCGKSFFNSAISAGFQSGLFLLLFFAAFFFFAILFSLTLNFVF